MVVFSVDGTVYQGRPQNARSQNEEKVYDTLDSLSINYERADHGDASTIERCRAVENILGVNIAKNLFLCNSQKTRFYILVMPGGKVFKTKDLSKQIGSARLSFGDAVRMDQLLGATPGSLSVFGLLNDTENKVSLLIDSDVQAFEYVGFHPCENTSTLKLRTDDILNVFLPFVGHNPTFVKLPDHC
jgi:Ala-tRNA(Pro) deacylase